MSPSAQVNDSSVAPQLAAGRAGQAGIRPANLKDLDALAALEQECFETDRLSRRQWRYMLTKAHAEVLLLHNRATSVARMYSIAVAGQARRLGVVRRRVQAAGMRPENRAGPMSGWRFGWTIPPRHYAEETSQCD